VTGLYDDVAQRIASAAFILITSVVLRVVQREHKQLLLWSLDEHICRWVLYVEIRNEQLDLSWNWTFRSQRFQTQFHGTDDGRHHALLQQTRRQIPWCTLTRHGHITFDRLAVRE